MILNMFNKDKKNTLGDKNISLIKITALLIHAAKIDENYTEKEKKIIMEFIVASSKNLDLVGENNLNINSVNLIKEAEEYEKNSNQILEFTQEIKKMKLDLKIIVIETLWKIILSDEKSDIYESGLIRRICGLLYVPDKLSGEIKVNILKEKKS